MESNKRISELLVETQAYTDLDSPVILTSGELGIYYINTEKLCQDNGKFNEYGDNSQAMIKHAIKMTEEHKTFGEIITILAENVSFLLHKSKEPHAVSGGQRRDWLFSGPVAKVLNVPHISLYKQTTDEDKIECILPHGGLFLDSMLTDFYVVHIVDLITEGSSVYSVENGKENGWVPMLGAKGAAIKDLVAVVTRLQGGEERLAEIGIKVHPFVAIDEDFMRKYSKNPDTAIAYLKNPKAWSENYLRENGALAFIETFNPNGKKLDRANKFLKRYYIVLETSGKLEELENAVNERYNKSLNEILEGE